MHEAYLRERGITGQDLELMTLEEEEDVQRLKTMFRLQFPALMSNIAKILLFRKEEKLACLLTAYYELSLDEESYYTAVESKNFVWLSFVWAFGKNFIGSRRNPRSNKVNVKALIEIIHKIFAKYPRRIEECCETVCKWKIMGDDDEHNVLWALLSEFQELLALKYMGYYWRFLKKELFVYALSNNNMTFMQKTL